MALVALLDSPLTRQLIGRFLNFRDWDVLAIVSRCLNSFACFYSSYSLPASDSRSPFFFELGSLPPLDAEESD